MTLTCYFSNVTCFMKTMKFAPYYANNSLCDENFTFFGNHSETKECVHQFINAEGVVGILNDPSHNFVKYEQVGTNESIVMRYWGLSNNGGFLEEKMVLICAALFEPEKTAVGNTSNIFQEIWDAIVEIWTSIFG